MSSGLEIRDPIHNFIYREPHEQDITDCRIFQRLRRLKQLALAYMLYPGAVHTRFDHSLGAFHVASRVAERLQLNSDDRRLLRLAALLHDIGHPPFSHVSEPILQAHTDPEKVKLKPKQQVHELISAQIIRHDTDLSKLILEKDRARIIGLLEGTHGYTVLKEIVSGPLDVDKQDYLLRDSYFCGVKYGVFDQERLINSLLIHEDNEDKFLAISRDGIHVLEQFVLAKYYMSTQVYRHRVRLITDAMVERGISLGIENDKIEWLKKLYSYDGTPDYVQEFLTWNDERLITKILEESPESYVNSFFTRLMERRLLKNIFDVDQKDFEDPAARLMVFSQPRDFHKPLEKMIGERFKFDPNLVICQLVEFKSAVKTESEVLVVQPTKATFFKEESTLFSAVDEAIHEQRFQIYGPAEYADERDKKKKLREFKSEIIDRSFGQSCRCITCHRGGGDTMNSTNFVLALVDASGGTVSGRTLLQKRAFFTSLLANIDPGLSFDAHYYGPYSSTVDSVTTQLKNLGFIEEKNLSFGVMSGGFEMKRYDYTLTSDGHKVLERIRGTEEYKRIAGAIQKIQRAGDPDYLVLSIAAKVFFILRKNSKPMSKAELQNEAEKLNWNLPQTSLERAVNFLTSLGVTQQA